jgi:hypothetical protein
MNVDNSHKPHEVQKILADLFQELPARCDNNDSPGLDEVEMWRDWSLLDTTPDQIRIEKFLTRSNIFRKRILHVGIGNSSLAKKMSRFSCDILGITISKDEISNAERLNISNYKYIIHNKYSNSKLKFGDSFDYIVDNNPTTFCCCLDHLMTMMRFYANNLSEDGQILCDLIGLGWVVSTQGANPRWNFSFDDIAIVARQVGLNAYRKDRFTIVLSRRPPSIFQGAVALGGINRILALLRT